MRLGSLFSGIGGLELGLERALGCTTVWQVEVDEFCRRVLERHWPNANRSVVDVRDGGDATLSLVDIMCGGFPCQDLSAAGKQKGLSGERSGLWYEYLRIVRELRPRVVVVENVASGVKKWLPFVREGLEGLGYNTTALAVSAEDVGAPHQRKRVFVVAHTDAVRELQPEGRESDEWGRPGDSCFRHERDRVVNAYGDSTCEQERRQYPSGCACGSPALGDADDERLEGRGLHRCECPNERTAGTPSCEGAGVPWRVGGAEPGLGGSAHGLPRGMDRWPSPPNRPQEEWEPPRTTPRGARDRTKRLRALGNAVVPQCAEVVGRYIKEQGWL